MHLASKVVIITLQLWYSLSFVLARLSLERTQTGFGKLLPATANDRLLNKNPSYEIMPEVLSKGGAAPMIWIHSELELVHKPLYSI